MEVLRDTYLEIDSNKIKNNVNLIKDAIGKDVALTAVVKANAYGHGIVMFSEILIECGCTYLAVATLSEALEIKKMHFEYPVIIMGYTPNRLLKYVVDNNITPTIFSYEQAEIISRLSISNSKIHIKIDTGFHRLGFPTDEKSINEIIKISKLKNLELEGIFSHLALASELENEKQYELFLHLIDVLESNGIYFKYKHIADSIATIDYPQYRLNMVRVGALIYGMRGFHKGFIPVEQALTWKAKIAQIHNISKGEGVSYDYKWKAKKDSTIATLPFGYADGYPRNLSTIGYVTLNGTKANIIGILCMDQCIIDITNIPNVSEGSEVVIYGSKDNEMTIQEASELARTNKNDILARLGSRLPRIYKNGGKI